MNELLIKRHLRARIISTLRTMHRKRGTPAWDRLHLQAVRGFEYDSAMQLLLLDLLCKKGTRRDIIEPIYDILDEASNYSTSSINELKYMYSMIDNEYPYRTRLVRAIAIATALNSKGEDMLIHITDRSWQDQLRFCEAILKRHRLLSPLVVLAAWHYVFNLHTYAQSEDASCSASTIEAYNDVVANIKKSLPAPTVANVMTAVSVR